MTLFKAGRNVPKKMRDTTSHFAFFTIQAIHKDHGKQDWPSIPDLQDLRLVDVSPSSDEPRYILVAPSAGHVDHSLPPFTAALHSGVLTTTSYTMLNNYLNNATDMSLASVTNITSPIPPNLTAQQLSTLPVSSLFSQPPSDPLRPMLAFDPTRISPLLQLAPPASVFEQEHSSSLPLHFELYRPWKQRRHWFSPATRHRHKLHVTSYADVGFLACAPGDETAAALDGKQESKGKGEIDGGQHGLEDAWVIEVKYSAQPVGHRCREVELWATLWEEEDYVRLDAKMKRALMDWVGELPKGIGERVARWVGKVETLTG